jgi:hypothetical protein
MILAIFCTSISLIASDDSKAAPAPESPRLTLAKEIATAMTGNFNVDETLNGPHNQNLRDAITAIPDNNLKDALNAKLRAACENLKAQLDPKNLTQSYRTTFTLEELETIKKYHLSGLQTKVETHQQSVAGPAMESFMRELMSIATTIKAQRQ